MQTQYPPLCGTMTPRPRHFVSRPRGRSARDVQTCEEREDGELCVTAATPTSRLKTTKQTTAFASSKRAVKPPSPDRRGHASHRRRLEPLPPLTTLTRSLCPPLRGHRGHGLVSSRCLVAATVNKAEESRRPPASRREAVVGFAEGPVWSGAAATESSVVQGERRGGGEGGRGCLLVQEAICSIPASF